MEQQSKQSNHAKSKTRTKKQVHAMRQVHGGRMVKRVCPFRVEMAQPKGGGSTSVIGHPPAVGRNHERDSGQESRKIRHKLRQNVLMRPFDRRHSTEKAGEVDGIQGGGRGRGNCWERRKSLRFEGKTSPEPNFHVCIRLPVTAYPGSGASIHSQSRL